MRKPVNLDENALVAAIEEAWHLRPANLRFVPSGEYGFCYTFDAEGRAWFAKIWPEPRPGYVSTESTLDMLRLTRALCDRGAFTALAAPIFTKSGNLHTMFGGRLLAIFPFIVGHRPVESEASAAAFGRCVAALQRATPSVADLPLRQETLDIPFAEALPQGFAFLEGVGMSDRAGRRAARDLIFSYRAEVMGELDRLRKLQSTIRAAKPPLFVSHRDIGTHNIIADDKGRLFFIDWDDVALAPPEHDLFFARGDWFGAALDAYFDAGGTRALSRDRFAFVHLRRVLDDMSFRLQTIMLDETGEADEHEVFGIEEWVIPAWLERKQAWSEMEDVLKALGVRR